MKLALDNVHTVNKRLSNGQIRTYHYHRLTKKRIEGEPGTLAFFASYEKASVPDEGYSEGTMKTVIEHYLRSGAFLSLAPSSKDEYRRNIKIIEDRYATLPIDALNDKRIKADFIEWHGQLAANSKRNADYALSVLKAIMRFAEEANIIDVSYAHGIRNVYKADRSDLIWTPEQVQMVLSAANSYLQTVIIFALNTGQRAGDLRNLRWDRNYKDGKFSLTQGKRKRFVTFPATQALRNLIGKLPRKSDFMLTTQTGAQWKLDYLSHEFGEAKRAVNLAHLNFHDFRGTAVTVLWENGSNEAEIASITGHSLETVASILERYTSRTAKMSTSAMQRLSDSWIGQLGLTVNQTVNQKAA